MRSLADSPGPSAELEDRIVLELKRSGMVRARGGFIMRSARVVGVAAVLAVVFVAGLAMGKREAVSNNVKTAATPVTPEGNQYMLLMFMHNEPGHAAPDAPAAPMSDEAKAAYARVIDEYRDWAIAREAEGCLVGADKLSDEARIMTKNEGEIAIAQTLDDTRVLGGYFTITAKNFDEAVEIAKSHPHLKYGGEVEIRPIEVTR
jgi:hypothetical protein